eukprot:s4631_g1.t1
MEEPLRHGDRLQVGWAVELLVVDTESASDLSMEVRGELWSRPLAVLVEEANELLLALGQVQSADHYKYFEAVDPAEGEEDLVRLRRKAEAAEEAVTFWPVADLRAEVKRLQDLPRGLGELYLSPTLARQPEDSPKDGRSRSVVLQPRSLPRNKVDDTPDSAIPSDCLVSSPMSQEVPQVAPQVPVVPEVLQSQPEEALLQKEHPGSEVEQAMTMSLQRAHHLSQCIGETVSALQETVAELRRSASGSFSVPEAFERLQLDNQEMKQRLNRLENQLERAVEVSHQSLKDQMGRWGPDDVNSQRSSAAVPSEHSTVPSQVLSGRVVIPRIRYEADRLQRVHVAPVAAVRSSLGTLSGRATSPIPARWDTLRLWEDFASVLRSFA